MEYIFIGIMLAIGFYLAPIILSAIVTFLAFIIIGICVLFGGWKDKEY